jgi:hypothetical protein
MCVQDGRMGASRPPSPQWPPSQPREPTLQLLEAQLEEAERVEVAARQSMDTLLFADRRDQYQRARILFEQAQAKRRDILRRIDEVSLQSTRS